MKLTRDLMLDRSRARDRAYDGRFLTGVLSTGIYCLPSCPARSPKEENVRFFLSEEEARAAGLRPCRRCRPDRFYRDEDPDLEALEALAERVRREPGAFADVAALAAESGLGATKLHGLFRRHFHTTPASFLQRARVDAARRALLGGRARILDIALDSGWDSASAFHDNFRRATGLAPGDYRRLARDREFALALPPGHLAGPTLAYLGRDPESPSERTWPGGFAKALLLAGRPALLRVDLLEGAARCRVESPALLPPAALGEAHEAVLRLLGLAGGGEPAGFLRRIAARPELRRLAAGREGLRIPLAAEPFEGLAWAIVGQQVNLSFAASLRRTVTELAGEPAGDGWIAPPSPAAVARLDPADLARRRFSRRKAEYLVGAAQAVAAGELPLAAMADGAATRAERRLLALRGIGPWTAQYVLLRSLGFADCLPVGDAGLAAALTRFFALEGRPGPAETRELMEPFVPFRSLATAHLWASLGDAP
jgi:AraC family transcriptional regulator, regulatory protein of adaptative response / DNA-3-methyladenine glycosylase II